MVKATKNESGLVSLYSGALQNLSLLKSADNSVDGKINTVLAANFAVLVFILSLVRDKQFNKLLLYSGIFLLMVSVICACLALRIREYTSAVVSIRDHSEYLDKRDRELLIQLIVDAELSYTNGVNQLDRKGHYYKLVMASFVVGSFLGVLSLYYFVS